MKTAGMALAGLSVIAGASEAKTTAEKGPCHFEQIYLHYPKEFKTGNTDVAIMTGFNHEEYFHGVELQEALIGSRSPGGRE